MKDINQYNSRIIVHENKGNRNAGFFDSIKKTIQDRREKKQEEEKEKKEQYEAYKERMDYLMQTYAASGGKESSLLIPVIMAGVAILAGVIMIIVINKRKK